MGENRRITQVRTARSVICRIHLLDGKLFEIDVDKRAVGQILFDKVCEHLDLIEKDYYGLSFTGLHTGLREWLNVEKKISKQMKGLAWEFKFEVKFYPPDPQTLHEDLTRYQLCLQIRNDIVNEKLPCSAVTYALLGSYTVQSELGDFDIDEFGPGTEYIRKMRFAPHQDRELLKKIAELHRTHKGQTPEAAELHFLENAKKLAMYGVDLSNAKDGENVDIQLGVCWSGILVFREKLQINKFVWPKILKMSYRRKKFYIKLRTGEFEEFQSLIGFKFMSSRHAKRMWKICVENHAFFRNREPDSPGTQRGLLRLGSKFRYSGRTHFQTKQAMMGVDRPSPFFDRVHSRATYHGRTKNKDLHDEMFKPRPEPRHIPEYNREEKMMKKVPEPEIHNREPEDVFDDDEDEEEGPDNRKSRMERMHAVPTPLAAVMKKDAPVNNNLEHHHRRRRSFEEADDREGVEDDMVRTDRLYNLEYTHANTNSGNMWTVKDTNQKSSSHSSLTKPNLKRQRGRQRTGSENFKKVSFDEESLRSASSQFSRSDSELWPQKLSVPKGRYLKKRTSSQSSMDSPLNVQSTMTSTPRNPLQYNQKVRRNLKESDFNSSVDEGFSDTFERNASGRKNDSNISCANSSKSGSFDRSPELTGGNTEIDKAHRSSESTQGQISFGGSLYRYSSSESDDDHRADVKIEEKKVNSTRQKGRRDRQKAQADVKSPPARVSPEKSGFVIQDLDSEPGHRQLGTKSLSKNYRIAPSEKAMERRAFYNESPGNSEDSFSYKNNEAILLEKYIIRKPDSEASKSPRDQKPLDDSILRSNLKDPPEEMELHDSFEYYGFAAGPQSTSSTGNILNESEVDSYHCDLVNEKRVVEEILYEDPSIKTELTKTTAHGTAEDEHDGNRNGMEDGRDAWTNSTASILSLSSEEGSARVDDFLQEYDNEPCVRRARSVTLGGEVSAPKNPPSASKKVRFSSEDNLVYELRHGFSDEEKSSGSPQKLDFDFIDDCHSDDQMSGSETSPPTPSLPRYFSDSDGSSSSCTPESSPRSPKNEAPLEESKTHRTLLQKSLKMPAEKKISEEDRDEYTCKEGFHHEEGFSNDNSLKDKSYVSENPISRRSQVKNDVLNTFKERISESDRVIEIDKEEICANKPCDDLTPLQSEKESHMMTERNVCRSLFKEAENSFEESSKPSASHTKPTTSVEISRNILDAANASKDGNQISGLDHEDLETKIQQSHELKVEDDSKKKSLLGKEACVPKTASVHVSDEKQRQGIQTPISSGSALSPSTSLPVRAASDSHSVSQNDPNFSTPDSAALTIDSGVCTLVQDDKRFTPTAAVAKQCVPGVLVQENNTSTNSSFATNASPPVDQSYIDNQSQGILGVSKSGESQRNSTFVSFQSSPVDKPYISYSMCAIVSTQGTTPSSQSYSNSTLGSSSSTLSPSTSTAASVCKPSQNSSGQSHSAFSDWNRKSAPVKPLTFIPPKKNVTITSTQQNKSEKIMTPSASKSTLSPNVTPPKVTDSKKEPNSQQQLDGCSKQDKDCQSGKQKQKSSGNKYGSTAKWVLSHSERFLHGTDELDKQEKQATTRDTTNRENRGADEHSSLKIDVAEGKGDTSIQEKRGADENFSGKVEAAEGKGDRKVEQEGKRNEQEVGPEGSTKCAKSEGEIVKEAGVEENTLIYGKENNTTSVKNIGNSGSIWVKKDCQDTTMKLDIHQNKSTLDCESPSDISSKLQELNHDMSKGEKEQSSNHTRNTTDLVRSQREPGDFYVSRSYQMYPKEAMFHNVSSRLYNENPKKKVYIDGSLQGTTRKMEAKKQEQQEKGKDSVDGVHSVDSVHSVQNRETEGENAWKKDINFIKDSKQKVENIPIIAQRELASERQGKDNLDSSMMGRRGGTASKEEAESKGKLETNRNRKDLKTREAAPLCESESSDFEAELGLTEYSTDNHPETLIREKPREQEKFTKAASTSCGPKKTSQPEPPQSGRQREASQPEPQRRERSVDAPPTQQEPPSVHDLPSPPLDPPELLSKEERKKREKEEKERKKKEKEEQKRKKKEEEKEKKRLAKEKKKKPAVEEKWQEAVAVSATSETIVTMDRAPRRMSSFEEQKDDKPEPREAEEQEVKRADRAEDSGSNRADQGSEEGSDREGDPKDEQAKEEDLNRSTDRVGEEFDL